MICHQCIEKHTDQKFDRLGRITFAALKCPDQNCMVQIQVDCTETQQIIDNRAQEREKILKLKRVVVNENPQLSQSHVKEGIYSAEAMTPDEYLERRIEFYECEKCKKPFHGGLANCQMDNLE